MTRHQTTCVILMIVHVAIMTGCNDKDARLAQMAEQYAERQAEQSERVVELQHELAEGSRKLVEADAQARKEMAALQREVGLQQDRLEADRRAIAAQRRVDPIIAAAITNIGLILACLLPLVLCWYLLRRGPEENVEADVNELLIRELIAEQPLLLEPPDSRPSLTHREEPMTGRDPGDVHDDHN